MSIKDIAFIQRHAPGQQFEFYDKNHKMIGRANIIEVVDDIGLTATEYHVRYSPSNDRYPYGVVPVEQKEE